MFALPPAPDVGSRRPPQKAVTAGGETTTRGKALAPAARVREGDPSAPAPEDRQPQRIGPHRPVHPHPAPRPLQRGGAKRARGRLPPRNQSRVADGCLPANGFFRLRGARGLPTDRREGREVVVFPRGPFGGQITDDVARSIPATCVAGDRESTRRRFPDRRHVGSRGGRERLRFHFGPSFIAVDGIVATGESARSAIHTGERMLRRRRRTPVGARGARR